jgi:hypothetical protein
MSILLYGENSHMFCREFSCLQFYLLIFNEKQAICSYQQKMFVSYALVAIFPI